MKVIFEYKNSWLSNSDVSNIVNEALKPLEHIFESVIFEGPEQQHLEFRFEYRNLNKKWKNKIKFKFNDNDQDIFVLRIRKNDKNAWVFSEEYPPYYTTYSCFEDSAHQYEDIENSYRNEDDFIGLRPIDFYWDRTKSIDAFYKEMEKALEGTIERLNILHKFYSLPEIKESFDKLKVLDMTKEMLIGKISSQLTKHFKLLSDFK